MKSTRDYLINSHMGGKHDAGQLRHYTDGPTNPLGEPFGALCLENQSSVSPKKKKSNEFRTQDFLKDRSFPYLTLTATNLVKTFLNFHAIQFRQEYLLGAISP